MNYTADFGSVFEKVRNIICENFGSKAEDITAETNLFEDLNADSLDLVDLVSAVEYEFGIEASDEDIEKIATVDDIVRYVIDFKSSN